jgi:hypothetical protein
MRKIPLFDEVLVIVRNNLSKGKAMESIFGYTVKNLHNNIAGETAYKLTGKRGAVYSLIRHQKQPDKMYVVSSNMTICSIKGNYTFSDKKGYLEALS